jgi:hypothetical protein
MDIENVSYTHMHTHIHNGELFSHKKYKIMSFGGKLIELENIILSEIRQELKVSITCFHSHVESER